MVRPCRASIHSSLVAAVSLSAGLMIGCASHPSYRVGVRVYDPYYRDYHVWNDDEVVYYQRWEVDTHRVHVEFHRAAPDVRREYWEWRHNNRD